MFICQNKERRDNRAERFGPGFWGERKEVTGHTVGQWGAIMKLLARGQPRANVRGGQGQRAVSRAVLGR